MKNSICELFKIQYPIIQAGMVWCSGWRLASAVSNKGGLGLIGAGSMSPGLLLEHIQKCKNATQYPFGVNLPLLYHGIEQQIEIIIQEKVPIVFTSAGNPEKFTSVLKSRGIVVVHVVSSAKFAIKAAEAGVDAVVAEGFEAGGHNGRDETTTLCLVPLVRRNINLPVIAAGGIASGEAMAAMIALGADAVQIGTRFAACMESSAHASFKAKVLESKEGETELVLKKLNPVRVLKNDFYKSIKELEDMGADSLVLEDFLGKGRSKKGIFDGNLVDGELEIGQIAALIDKSETVSDIMSDLLRSFETAKNRLATNF